MTERGRSPLVAAISFAVVLLIGVSAEIAGHGARFNLAADLDLITGLALGGSGALALAREPRSRIGPLLLLCGGLWFIGTIPADTTDLGRLVRALTYLYVAPLIHAALTYPSGRSIRPIERAAVAGAWIASLLAPLWGRESGLVLLGALLVGAASGCWWTLPSVSRRHRAPGLATAVTLGVALPGKIAVAAAFHSAGIAFLSSPEIVWELVLIASALWLARSLLALMQRRSSLTDVVIELDERGGGAALPLDQVGDDPQVLASIARAREIAARNQDLRTELKAQLTELAASRRRSLEAGDEERLALEERLRDPVARTLAGVAELIRSVRAGIPIDVPEAADRVDRALAQLALARTELDELARGLGPRSLRQRGLAAALRELAELSPVPVDVEVDPTVPTTAAAEPTLYFAASEALANIARHSHARHVWLRLRGQGAGVSLSVADDGVGGADLASGSGLRGLRDRVEALGGQLVVGPREGGGTVLTATIP